MRSPSIRQERACIRPEISRTVTFGEFGTSNGQYFHEHLQHMQLNEASVLMTLNSISFQRRPQETVDYSRVNISTLVQAEYDKIFLFEVYNTSQLVRSIMSLLLNCYL